MFEHIIHEIEKANIITIYPHQSPDGDALGSCFGMKELLKYKYPNKEVYVLGLEGSIRDTSFFPSFDCVPIDTIKNSLALAIDTANIERVDEQNVRLAKKIIKIDHHPDREPYGDISYVDDKMSSCAEIICQFGRELYQEERFPLMAARYLYGGLFTDTMGFTTSSANAHSLETASYLASYGLNLNEISYLLTSRDYVNYNYVSQVRSLATVEGACLVAIISKDVYEKCGLQFDDATGCVSEFAKIRGLKVWAIFVEADDPTVRGFAYIGSLRSRDCIVNDIAYNHHGGGHTVAAGCKAMSKEELDEIISELKQRANEN